MADLIMEAYRKMLKESEDKIVARWESKSKKDWVNLLQHSDGSFSYKAKDAFGHIGKVNLETAIKNLKTKIDDNYFHSGKPL